MKKRFKLYGEFTKVEEQEDGTLKVAGVASSEAQDSDGEIVTAEAMKAALPDYMKFGAVREMHTAWAAGTALKAEVDAEKRTQFEALVVDGEAIKKVQSGVYKGFSIGGKVTERDPDNKSLIKGIKLIEVSLVDRPANPEAVFSMGKVEGDGPTLGELRKGMWEVSVLADLLMRLGWLAQDVAREAEWEGDSSPVPADLRDAVALLGESLKAMTQEEIDELLASLPAKPDLGALTQAAATADLAKAGKRFSKATREALAEIHKAMKDCDSKLAAMKYDEDSSEEGEEGAGGEGEEGEKAARAEALQKAEGAKQEALAKVTDLEAQLAKATTEKADLAKRVAELEAQPAAPKGALKVVSKADDVVNSEKEAELKKKAEEISALPPTQQATELIKAIHSNRTGGQ